MEKNTSAWDDIFCKEGIGFNSWVYIEDHLNKKIYGGWVYAAGSEDTTKDICLSNVAVYSSEDRNNLLYELPYVYINLENDRFIEMKNAD